VKKIMALLVVAGLVSMITGCPPATSNPPPASATKTTGTTDSKTVEGKFVSYDKEKNSIVVHVGEKDETYNVKEAKDSVKFEDLKKDDALKLTVKDKDASKVEKK